MRAGDERFGLTPPRNIFSLRSTKYCHILRRMTRRKPQVDIVDTVVARLHAVDMPGSEIAKAAGVKENWLRALMRGEIPNPGVRTFVQVCEFLDKHEKHERARA